MGVGFVVFIGLFIYFIRQSDVLAPEPQEIRVELPDAFKEAFSSDVPFVVDIRIDPEEDMLPMLPGGVASKDGTIRSRCRWNQAGC